MTLEAEVQVIGNLMKKNSLIQSCDLMPGEFQDEQLAEIYQAILDINLRNETADLVTLGDHLQAKTGKNWLRILSDTVSNAWNDKAFKQHAQLIRKSYLCREASFISTTLQFNLSERGDLTAIDNAIRDLMAINVSQQKYEYSMAECIEAAIQKLEQKSLSGELPGVPTGFKEMDTRLGGFHDGDLIVIGARPSMGKTALLFNMADRSGVGGGIITAEQDHEQCGERFICIDGGIDSQKVRTGTGMSEADWKQVANTITRLKSKPLKFYDQPSVSITTVIRIAREWKYKYNIKILYVDYLQLIKNPARSRTEEVGGVADALKSLAKELSIPVVALAQVKREVETRANKRPMMSDLSDASEIEKHADLIAMLYRDSVYNDECSDGIAEIDFCKNRHGPTGVINCVFIDKFMQFVDMDKAYKSRMGVR